MIYLAGRRHKYSVIHIMFVSLSTLPITSIFYSYDTSTLQVLTFARHPLPQTSEDSLVGTPTVTQTIRFESHLKERMTSIYTCCRAFKDGTVNTCFND